MLFSLPRMFAAERWPAQVGGQHGSLPASPLFHARIRPAHQQRQPIVPRLVSTGAHPTDVRLAKHDGCLRSTPRPLPHLRRRLPWQHVNEGGWRADDAVPGQEQQLLRGLDPEQCQNGRLRHPTAWPQDVGHVRCQQHCHPAPLQAYQRAVHGYVPEKGFLALVHWRGHGRNGVHRGECSFFFFFWTSPWWFEHSGMAWCFHTCPTSVKQLKKAGGGGGVIIWKCLSFALSWDWEYFLGFSLINCFFFSFKHY